MWQSGISSSRLLGWYHAPRDVGLDGPPRFHRHRAIVCFGLTTQGAVQSR